MASTKNGLRVWKKFQPFEVFGDYLPMSGFRVLVHVQPDPAVLSEMIERRSGSVELLDPALARNAMRAGLGLLRSGVVSFAYATSEETVAVVRADAVRGEGDSIAVYDAIVSSFAARLSLLMGAEIPAAGRIYEFPDMEVVRRAMVTIAEDVEDSTPLRTSLRLGAQLRGRGQAFHPSMVETLEEQTSLLQSNGIDMDALPAWWWRGVAGLVDGGGSVSVYDELPAGEALGELLPE